MQEIFRKTTLYLFALVWATTASLMAQSSYIPLQADYALFKSDHQACFLEIYLSFYQQHLQFAPTDSGYQASFTTRLEVYQGDSLLTSEEKNFTDRVARLEQVTPGRQFMDIYTYRVLPGTYRFRLLVEDKNAHRKGEFELHAEVSPFSEQQLTLSDVQLCTRIQKNNNPSRFNKGNLQVIPNPSAIYGEKLPVLYYYAEVYNLSPAGDKGTYTVQAFIKDVNGEIVRTLPARTYAKTGQNAAVVGGYNIVTLEGKPYFFYLRLRDDDTGEQVEKMRRFLMYKHPDQLAAVSIQDYSQRLREYYETLDEEQLDQEFTVAGYIASKEEREVYASLDRQGKIDFLVEFWRRRDSDPRTPENEYREEYFTLVRYANEHFTVKNKPGWESDRGRVLLTYGRPDQIDRHVMRSEMKPYEVWHYNQLEGGVVFVFADLTGFGDYQLVHSSYSKELQHPEWEEFLRQSTFPDRGLDVKNPGDGG